MAVERRGLSPERRSAAGRGAIRPDRSRRTLQYMADEESGRVPGGREAGLRAARDAFYRGDIAREIIGFIGTKAGCVARGHGELSSPVVPPERRRFGDLESLPAAPGARGRRCCKPWRCSKAPIGGLGHNSADYIHTLTEAMKLAFADREALRDPPFGNVPLPTLISSEYAAERRK